MTGLPDGVLLIDIENIIGQKAKPKAPTRRGDMVTTAHGEQITADAYPEVITDRELLH